MNGREIGKGTGAEALRFLVTGAVCFLIEWGALVLMVEKLGWDTMVATPAAFLVSVIVNYLLCVVWVFRGAKDNGAAAKAGFLVTSLMGLALNWLLMWVLRNLLGEEQVLLTLAGKTLKMYMVNKCIATVLVMIWNYFTKKAILTGTLAQRLIRRENGQRSESEDTGKHD